jgi:hypothetical protein
LSGNAARGGNGGDGAPGSDAQGSNASGGNGGNGGYGGYAAGGAVFLSVGGTHSVTILNDAAHPSLMTANFVYGGFGGDGGPGGTSTGTANNSNGGDGGHANDVGGGALYIEGATGATGSISIGNTAFFGNSIIANYGGIGGLAGTGGSGTTGKAGAWGDGGSSSGGGIVLAVQRGSVKMVNSTVAYNAASPGYGGVAIGGGIVDSDTAGVSDTFENNTITHNTLSAVANSNGEANDGAGFVLYGSNPTLINNLIQANQSIRGFAPDFFVFPAFTTPLTNASNNFIGSMSANAVSTTSNIIGISQAQLGSVVGGDFTGKPTGGPIYYPLLSGTVSIGAGSTSVLNTIAGVEGTTTANATDEIGNPRSSLSSIDLGAVQFSTGSVPLISTNPTSQTVTAGANVSFTASAADAWSVQWQVSTDGGKTFTPISGAISTTLTLNNVTTAMSGYEYEAVFTNGIGSISTSAATLTVNNATPPTITSGNSATFTAGQFGSFPATATGFPTPSLTESGPLPSGVTLTDNGNGTATLGGTPAVGTQGTYQITITAHNGVGSDFTQSFTLTVNPAPQPPPSPPPPPPGSPSLNVPPLLAFFDSLFAGIETVNANGTVTITDRFLGIPLIVSTFDSNGNLMIVDLFGFFDIMFLFV